MCECCDVLRPALERLLKDASWFTKERCSKYGEPYGNGTDAEHEARQALESTKDATTERDALKAEVQRLREAVSNATVVIRGFLRVYGELHASLDLGECDETVQARAVLAVLDERPLPTSPASALK